MADRLDDLMPKVLPLLRMLVSGTDGEVVNSVSSLRRILSNADLDIHVIVERVEMSTVTARQQLYDSATLMVVTMKPRSSDAVT
jgi:hypothetical protein